MVRGLVEQQEVGFAEGPAARATRMRQPPEKLSSGWFVRLRRNPVGQNRARAGAACAPISLRRSWMARRGARHQSLLTRREGGCVRDWRKVRAQGRFLPERASCATVPMRAAVRRRIAPISAISPRMAFSNVDFPVPLRPTRPTRPRSGNCTEALSIRAAADADGYFI